ncbi:MAG: large subunit ribosomal protein L1 [archaeon GW2011_AR3]|nr:MAG: large subunit ribosomal protein L1 [archaeon GW2011_AR3]MBS3109036.1 50S ribosomal protein L1 [Candidatus Woesearchaeota archaeon]
MDKKVVLDALKQVREGSTKRNFKQSFDFIINVRGIDLKKTENQIEFFMTLKHTRSKKAKVCALVGAELSDEAKSVCDFSVVQDDFQKYGQDKKAMKKLAEQYDFFIAQANIMPKVAGAFGRVLGPRGKMPNPKAGCIVPPKFNLRPLYDKLQHTVKISLKTSPIIQTVVGSEDKGDDEIADNILNIYDQVVHHLPNDKNNINSMFIKLTMGRPVQLLEKVSAEVKKQKKSLLHKKHDEPKKAEAVAQ